MSEPSTPACRAPVRSLTGVQIVATGSYLPDNVVTNEDLASLGCDAEWIIKRTGIRERRHAPPGISTSHMAVAAAERCIEQSGLDRREIDLLLVATMSPDRLTPATATTVQDRLGLCCGAMDLSAACAGFSYALMTAASFVAAGASRACLVIGADTNSRILDPHDVKTYPLFGDGAGAVLVLPGSSEQGAIAYTLGSEGSGADLLCRQSGGVALPYDPQHWYLEMDGRAVFKWAVRLLDEVSRNVVCGAGFSLDQIDWWLLHQANVRILDAAAESLGIDREKVLMHLDRYGNTSAASIPIVLDEALREGKIKRGQLLLMSGFGAGLTWGTTVFRM